VNLPTVTIHDLFLHDWLGRIFRALLPKYTRNFAAQFLSSSAETQLNDVKWVRDIPDTCADHFLIVMVNNC